MDAQALYLQLGQLVSELPTDLSGPGRVSTETHVWLGRAAALIEEQQGYPASADKISFRLAVDGLHGPLQPSNAHTIISILHRALARAEKYAPPGARGAFITVGAEFSALQAIAKVVREASTEVLIVDPYMDATVLTDFAPLAPEGVAIRLLADSFYTKTATMRPPTERWVNEYGNTRPLEVKLSAQRALHDRLIIVDAGVRVWSLTQSLKDFAARSPGSVLRVDGDVAAMKRDHYIGAWSNASPLY